MRLFVLFVSVVFLVSCESAADSLAASSQSGELLSVVESKNIIGDLSTEEYSPDWVPVEKRAELVRTIIENVKSGKNEVFEFFPGELIPMSKKDLDYLFYHKDSLYIEEGATMRLVVTEEEFGPEGIVYLKFKEELYFDKENFKFSKRITQVAPMEKVYNEDGTIRGYRGLFWVKL